MIHSKKQKELKNYCEILNNQVIAMTIPVFKPEDWTSFDVVKKMRNISRIKKVGHAGTLDPFATGLLILGFGKDTKKLDGYKILKKEYIVDIELGISTDTMDRTGKVIMQKKDIPEYSISEIQSVVDSFIGKIQQIPPMYSAKKINGKRLYKYAREGVEIERKANEINIYSIDILSYSENILKLKVECSSGTYIRVLANDIGEKLGCGGHAKELIRSKIGEYSVDECFHIDDFQKDWAELIINESIAS
ncbi:MAG: tRNA pseudouridine(55) synthase TruB [Candidatus Marinimicrobia bacterium]|nr:tRNA pseudouridine(55) synthase TruB [Candidatus Neomarinimicrobiota bacterium]